METVGLLEFVKAHLFSILLATTIILSTVFFLKKKPKGTPPGSLGFPFVGHLFHLMDKPGKVLSEMRDKYGPVFTIYMGPYLTVVVNDYETAKEAFLKHGEVLSGRPHWYLFEITATEPGQPGVRHGIGAAEGKLWKEQRKFALTKLREFGMGKVSLEKKIKEEISMLMSELQSKNGSPFDIQYMLNTSVANIICSIVFGDRFDYEDEKFQLLLRALNGWFKDSPFQGFLQFFPAARFFPSEGIKLHRFLKNSDKLFEFIQDRISEHVKNFDIMNIQNFIDAYLAAIHEQDKMGKTDSFSVTELKYVIRDLFSAGTETTSTTLRWAFLYLIKHRDVMRKVQAEIDEVIGRNRLPKMADKPQMPYVDATILEIQRCANIVPIGVPHRSSESLNFKNFVIPADTIIIANLTAILNDTDYFENPEQFNPERFIGPDGKVTGHETLAPFSVGRRVCPGETLARMELFLFFTSFLQNFDLALPDGVTEPNMKGTLGVTFLPANDPIKFLPR